MNRQPITVVSEQDSIAGTRKYRGPAMSQTPAARRYAMKTLGGRVVNGKIIMDKNDTQHIKAKIVTENDIK